MEIEWNYETLELFDRILSRTAFNKEQLEAIVRNVVGRQKILDLCVGFGNLAKLLVESGKDVWGVDISTDSLEYARRKVDENNKSAEKLRLINADIRHINYINEFDAVTCVSSLPSDSDLDNVVENMHCALKPKGVIAVTGIEQIKHKEALNLMLKELKEAIERKELEISPKDILILQRYADIQGIVGSSERLKLVLEDSDFIEIRTEPFYHGTCYSLTAIKP